MLAETCSLGGPLAARPLGDDDGRIVDLKKVTTVADIVTASVIKGMLESAGIPVLMRSSGSAGWLFPGTPGSGGAVDVFVPAECFAEAQGLIAEAEEDGRAS
jgi:hypothetical protein